MFSSSERAEKFRRKWKERKDKEEEKKWREIWDEIRKEMELELKGRGRLSKEMYYRMGKILIDFKKGKKDIPRHRGRTAIKVYLTYKDNEEFDDGIKIREINKEKKAGLKEFSNPTVVYWHDTGHAQIKENLGFIHHAMHLESLSERLYGFHIHDVQFPGRDHCAPGTGMIDFAALKPCVKPEQLKVFEFSPGLTPDEVRAGIDHLKQIWGSE